MVINNLSWWCISLRLGTSRLCYSTCATMCMIAYYFIQNFTDSDEERGNFERHAEELVSLNKQTPLFDSTDTGKSQVSLI